MSDTQKTKTFMRGGAKRVSTQYGELINFWLNVDQVKELADDKGWINLTIGVRKETDQYGNTHSIWLNDYKKPDQGDDKKLDEDEVF